MDLDCTLLLYVDTIGDLLLPPLKFAYRHLGFISRDSRLIMDKFHDVRMGRKQLCCHYFANEGILQFWRMAHRVYCEENKQLSGLDNFTNKTVFALSPKFLELKNALPYAARQNELNPEWEYAIGERWTILDDICKGISLAGDEKIPSPIPTW